MNTFRTITLVSLCLALSVLIFGTYVRLSGAAVGCPDWPGCYGSVFPPVGADAIREAESAFPDKRVDGAKAWTVMTYRYLVGTLTVALLALAVTAWRQKQHRTLAFSGAVTLLVLGAAQIFLSKEIIRLEGTPGLVLSQLLVGMAGVSLLYWLFLRTDAALEKSPRPQGPSATALAAFFVLFCVIGLGGWTSANYAGLACADFPTCQGSWWPDAGYADAFVFWRGLFGDASAPMLSYEARVAIHWAHRVGALIVFVMLGVLIYRATARDNHPRVKRSGTILSVLLLVQVALGVVGIRQGVPLIVALAHTTVAALMLMVLVHIRVYSRYRLAEAPAPGVGETGVTPQVAPAGQATGGAALQPEVVVEPEVYLEKAPENLYRRLKSQLKRTRAGLGVVLGGAPFGQTAIDAELIQDIEDNLLMADVGLDATRQIIDELTAGLERRQLNDAEALNAKLREILLTMLQPCNHALTIPDSPSPFVILVVGVNGVGKTTTIGKLAKRLQAQGRSVMLAAGDTFRAAAVEQLQTWGERNSIQVIAQHAGADSASVIYDAVQAAKARHVDVLIADTAGRLHTKSNLMEELRKIRRIIGKLDESAPHEVLLVLDAGTGQNALSQAEQFNQAVALTGIALTKLDGTAKGGIIFALAKKFGIPIRFIGIGEGIDDLQDFDAESFVNALFATD